MTRQNTVFNPIQSAQQAIANDQTIAFYQENIAPSILSVHSEVDITEDLKAVEEKSIAELLEDDRLSSNELKSLSSVSKSPKSKKKHKDTESTYEKEEISETEEETDSNQETPKTSQENQ